MSQLIEKPDKILKDIKIQMLCGVKDRNHGFHTPVFSNLTSSSQINSKLVVLREFNNKLMNIIFHTDFRSRKINEINNNPKTSFLFYDMLKSAIYRYLE